MKYSEIKLNDVANSPHGVTLSLWTQFCPHHCRGCFNESTWSSEGGYIFTDLTYEYIKQNIDKYGVNRSLSLLGGEPLSEPNIDGILALCNRFKLDFPNKDIYLWTGYRYEDLNEKQLEVFKNLTIMVDGRFEEDKKDLSLKLRGSSNQRVIDVQETLNSGKIVNYI